MTVYTYESFAADDGPGAEVEAAFEAICDCDLKYVSVNNPASILNKLKLEGETAVADVVLGIDSSQVIEAQNTGLMVPHKMFEIVQPALDLPGQWTNPNFLPFGFGFFAFMYHEARLTSPPDSFEALLQADNKLKIVIQDPQSTTTGLGLLLWIKALYNDQAADVWKRLAPKIQAVTQSNLESNDMLRKGEADMILSLTTTPAYFRVMENEPQFRAAAFKEGHGIMVEVAGIPKNAPNPDLARQFLEFILTPAFQSLIPSHNWMYPVIFPEDGLPEAFIGLVRPSRGFTIDAQGVTNNRLDWIDEFNQALNQ